MTTQSPWYIHNLNPIAFTVGSESVPWYWLNYLFGFIWCFLGLRALNLQRPSRNTLEDIQSFAAWGWIGMLLGARLFYVMLYNFDWFKSHPDQIMALWNGGMSFHGGLLGIALAGWLVATLRRVDFLAFTDLLAVLVPWPLATGRICNFLNGELPGRPADVWWAVIFPEPWNDFPRHPSQLYEGLSEGVFLGLIMLWAWRKGPKHRGALSAIFLASYGGLRFFTEFTREPDPQLGFLFTGLTMGQLLCLVMVASGAFMITRIQKISAKY